jgi:GT2 family glycosyltransferase
MAFASYTNLIVTYNSADDILNLLADLRAYAPASWTILIDNASNDRTAQLVGEQYPEVQLIRNSENVGYARAVNQGFDLCTTEYVLLLNPDIRIGGPDVFTALEDCLKDSQRIAVAAPLQFKSEGNMRHLNHSFSHWSLEAFKVYVAFLLHQRQSFRIPIQVTYLNAGCLFVRRSAFYEVGKLTEKYFLYGEEPDLFLKFKRYGFQCYLLPQVDVTHYRDKSLNTVPLPQRLRIRFRGILNVMDALAIGWWRILADKLTVRRPRKMEGN